MISHGMQWVVNMIENFKIKTLKNFKKYKMDRFTALDLPKVFRCNKFLRSKL